MIANTMLINTSFEKRLLPNSLAHLLPPTLNYLRARVIVVFVGPFSRVFLRAL